MNIPDLRHGSVGLVCANPASPLNYRRIEGANFIKPMKTLPPGLSLSVCGPLCCVFMVSGLSGVWVGRDRAFVRYDGELTVAKGKAARSQVVFWKTFRGKLPKDTEISYRVPYIESMSSFLQENGLLFCYNTIHYSVCIAGCHLMEQIPCVGKRFITLLRWIIMLKKIKGPNFFLFFCFLDVFRTALGQGYSKTPEKRKLEILLI